MCGLVGFSSVRPPDENKLQLLMLYNALERGKESTGIYSPSTGIVKTIEPLMKFIKHNDLSTKDNTFIGHVRSSTIGVVTQKNAHPFQYGNTVLAHNGTLRYALPLIHRMGMFLNDFTVDSQVICCAIDRFKNNLNFLTEIDGAIAILWADTEEPNTIKVFRNTERPLFYGYINNDMYISSLEESLDMINCEKIKQFDINTVYTITNGEFTKRRIKVRFTYSPPNYYTMKINNDNKDAIDVTILHNRWLKSNANKRRTKANEVVFIKDKWYYCTDELHKDHHSITMIGEDSNLYVNSKFCIDYTDFNISKNDYMICMDNVYSRHMGKKLVAKEGEIVMCGNTFQDGDVSVNNLENNDWTYATKAYVRKAEKWEVEEYLLKEEQNAGE